MKLVFPNGELEQIDLQPGTTTIGSGEDCDIVLDADGVSATHARLEIGQQGLVIEVDDATNITRVNGTLVVVRTRISPGDALLIGTVTCQVNSGAATPAKKPAPPPIQRASKEDQEEDGATKIRMAIPKYLLRGVSGSTFGKNFPLYKDTTIGRHSECDICLAGDEVSRKHAKISVTMDGLTVEDMGSSNGTFINGKQVEKGKLSPGDELRLDTVRFLVQVPGMEQPPAGETQDATNDTAPEESVPEKKSASGVIIAVVVIVIAAAAAGGKFAGLY